MKFQPVKKDDIVILNTGVHKAIPVSIQKDTDIFKYCRKCSLNNTNYCYVMSCRNTYFKKVEGGL